MKREDMVRFLRSKREEDEGAQITISCEWFIGLDYRGLDFSRVVFQQCLILGVCFDTCDFKQSNFNNCIICACSFEKTSIVYPMIVSCCHDIGQPISRTAEVILKICEVMDKSGIKIPRPQLDHLLYLDNTAEIDSDDDLALTQNDHLDDFSDDEKYRPKSPNGMIFPMDDEEQQLTNQPEISMSQEKLDLPKVDEEPKDNIFMHYNNSSKPLSLLFKPEPLPRYGWGNYKEFVKKDDSDLPLKRVFVK